MLVRGCQDVGNLLLSARHSDQVVALKSKDTKVRRLRVGSELLERVACSSIETVELTDADALLLFPRLRSVPAPLYMFYLLVDPPSPMTQSKEWLRSKTQNTRWLDSQVLRPVSKMP